MEVKTVKPDGVVQTLCRMCDTRCAVNVHLKDGVIADITPFEGHPVNQGKICPRGSAAIDQFYHIDRITKPLKKQADGTFIEISRQQAWMKSPQRLINSGNPTEPDPSGSGRARAWDSSSRRNTSGDSRMRSVHPIIFPTTLPATTAVFSVIASSPDSGTHFLSFQIQI